MDAVTLGVAFTALASVAAPFVHAWVAKRAGEVVAEDADQTLHDFAHAVADATHGKVMDTVRAELPKLVADGLKLANDLRPAQASLPLPTVPLLPGTQVLGIAPVSTT